MHIIKPILLVLGGILLGVVIAMTSFAVWRLLPAREASPESVTLLSLPSTTPSISLSVLLPPEVSEPTQSDEEQDMETSHEEDYEGEAESEVEPIIEPEEEEPKIDGVQLSEATTEDGEDTKSSEGFPGSFFYADEILPGVALEPRMATTHNFTDRPLPGYAAERVVLTQEMATRLALVQEDLATMGLALKIYDGYRPIQAEEEMQRRILDTEDPINPEYHPRMANHVILERGFIVVGSTHTRGAGVDLTLIILESGEELDMGSIYLLFDDMSHTYSDEISAQAQQNRLTLKWAMERAGLVNFYREWWHYQLAPQDQPYSPDNPFRFVIE